MLFTLRLVTGTIWSGVSAVMGATGWSGLRYAFFIQKPSHSLSRTVIDVTHFTHESLAHPGAITRSGKPCFTGIVSPFIS